MLPQQSEMEMFTVIAFAALAIVLSLPGLLARSSTTRRASWRSAAVLAGVFSASGAASALAGLPVFVWLPLLLFVPVWLLFALCRTNLIASSGQVVAGLLGQVRCQAALLMLLGGSVLAWQSYTLTRDVEHELTETDALLATIAAAPPLEDDPHQCIVTDAGQRIPLFRSAGTSSAEDARLEKEYLHRRGFNVKVIQTGEADHTYNCHGWVFAGGKGWVRGSFVDQILRDNRYQTASSPSPGDVAIFRDKDGVVSHTALVRSVHENGTILLESKWGKLGRFLHTSTQHVYSADSCMYYRSSRANHLVQLKRTEPAA